MSRGKWSDLACPNGFAERAELACALLDVTARLIGATQELGALSERVRAIEIQAKRRAA